MNRTLVLVLTAVVSAGVGGASMWFVMRPGPPADIRLDISVPMGAQVKPVMYYESEVAREQDTQRKGNAAIEPIQNVAMVAGTEVGEFQNVETPAAQEIERGAWELRGSTKQASIMQGTPVRSVSFFVSVPQQIDVTTAAKAARHSQMIIPNPREAFVSLGPVEKKTWLKIIRPQSNASAVSGTIESTALRLGVAIADGFIAIEAEDTGELAVIGGCIFQLSQALKMKTAKRRYNSMMDGVARKDWQRLRLDLDSIVSDSDEVNHEFRNLVSLGSWLRGTEALTRLIEFNYSEETAECLRQSLIIDYFERVLADLPNGVRGSDLISSLRGSLAEMKTLMENSAPIPSLPNVGKIGKIAGTQVARINSAASGRGSLSAR